MNNITQEMLSLVLESVVRRAYLYLEIEDNLNIFYKFLFVECFENLFPLMLIIEFSVTIMVANNYLSKLCAVTDKRKIT